MEDFSALKKVKKQKFEVKFKDEKSIERTIDLKSSQENPIKIIISKYIFQKKNYFFFKMIKLINKAPNIKKTDFLDWVQPMSYIQ